MNNKVGIGTNAPNAPLEINPASGNAAFRLNYTGKSTWTISNTGDIVTFSKVGSGGQEATFRPQGDSFGGLATFEVKGSIKATNVTFSSARALKTAFEPLSGKAVLAQLTQLPVSSWRYKTEPETALHYGPMAEDFHAAFGLGSGATDTISTVDGQGVAFAAIQGLHEMILERDGELELLRQELAALRAHLEMP